MINYSLIVNIINIYNMQDSIFLSTELLIFKYINKSMTSIPIIVNVI